MPKPGLTEAEFKEAMGQIQAIYDCLDTLPNIVGPTYGASMGDRALKIEHALHFLAVGIEDQAYDAGIKLDLAQPAPFKHPGEARNALDGSFPTNAPVRGRGASRLWTPLTPKEHHALGLRMKDAKTRIAGLIVKLSNAYPKTGGRRLASAAWKVDKVLQSFCNTMDSRAHNDCPTYGDCPLDQDGIGPARSWYYGPISHPMPGAQA